VPAPIITARDDEQHDERHAIGGQASRQRHPDRARRHDQQPDDERFLIADPLDQLCRGDRREEIGDEPHALDQGGLGIVEVEDAPEVREQRVVDDGDEAPHEKQRREQRQRGAERLRRPMAQRQYRRKP